LVEAGSVAGMTPGQIQKTHEIPTKYSNHALSSAQSGMRGGLKKELGIVRGSGFSGEHFHVVFFLLSLLKFILSSLFSSIAVLQSHSILHSIAEDASYNSSTDPDWEAGLSNQVSVLGMGNDDYSYDTRTVRGHSMI